ncbi:hypothetical protein FWH30_00565 [Microgenomates group bacterium]|nr:hypothetical protein [Microgenomates group bacterium]
MARDEKVKLFIKEKRDLFWYIQEPREDNVTDELLVETILNYGRMKDVWTLIELMGMQKVATTFRSMLSQGRKQNNFFPAVKNYFQLFFNHYASGNTK